MVPFARYPSYYGYEDHNGGGGVLLPPVVWARGSQGLRSFSIPIASMYGIVALPKFNIAPEKLPSQ